MRGTVTLAAMVLGTAIGFSQGARIYSRPCDDFNPTVVVVQDGQPTEIIRLSQAQTEWSELDAKASWGTRTPVEEKRFGALTAGLQTVQYPNTVLWLLERAKGR